MFIVSLLVCSISTQFCVSSVINGSRCPDGATVIAPDQLVTYDFSSLTDNHIELALESSDAVLSSDKLPASVSLTIDSVDEIANKLIFKISESTTLGDISITSLLLTIDTDNKVVPLSAKTFVIGYNCQINLEGTGQITYENIGKTVCNVFSYANVNLPGFLPNSFTDTTEKRANRITFYENMLSINQGVLNITLFDKMRFVLERVQFEGNKENKYSTFKPTFYLTEGFGISQDFQDYNGEEIALIDGENIKVRVNCNRLPVHFLNVVSLSVEKPPTSIQDKFDPLILISPVMELKNDLDVTIVGHPLNLQFKSIKVMKACKLTGPGKGTNLSIVSFSIQDKSEFTIENSIIEQNVESNMTIKGINSFINGNIRIYTSLLNPGTYFDGFSINTKQILIYFSEAAVSNEAASLLDGKEIVLIKNGIVGCLTVLFDPEIIPVDSTEYSLIFNSECRSGQDLKVSIELINDYDLNPKTNNKKTIIIIAVVCVLAIIGGIVCYLLLYCHKKKNANDPDVKDGLLDFD